MAFTDQVRRPLIPYTPTQVPSDRGDWPRWLTDELYRLGAYLENRLQADDAVMLYGALPNIAITSTPAKQVNYAGEGAWNDGQYSTIDAVAGEIIVPGPGVFRLTMHWAGVQGNTTKGSGWLDIDVDGVKQFADMFSVAANTVTLVRALNATYTRAFNGGERLSLYVTSDANFGTFTNVRALFQLERLQGL